MAVMVPSSYSYTLINGQWCVTQPVLIYQVTVYDRFDVVPVLDISSTPSSRRSSFESVSSVTSSSSCGSYGVTSLSQLNQPTAPPKQKEILQHTTVHPPLPPPIVHLPKRGRRHRRRRRSSTVPSESLTTSPHSSRMKGDSYPVTNTADLSLRQVDRLRSVLSERVDIHGRGNFPTITVKLLDLIVCVRKRLRAAGVGPKQVKLNGGAASFVVAADEFVYSDLDLIFPIHFEAEDTFDKVRIAVFDALVELMPDETNKARISADTLKDIYIRKMVKVSDDDRWSLFSLHNDFGRCIELKFVDKMRRQFEFSVDSFQITLDALLDNFDQANIKVVIESMFGDIRMAMEHLDQRLIDTRRPEEIRGGGLLKYCHLLTRGYKAARPGMCRKLEKYMCSRFFIDFPDVNVQETKLRNYLDNHFGNNSDSWSSSGDETDSEASTSQASSHQSMLSVQQAKYDYLLLLYRVISESTVCLMNHERRQTLYMVDRLAYQVSMNIYRTRDYTGHQSRQTLLYLPKNSSTWIPVV